jgi:hypothetical protein
MINNSYGLLTIYAIPYGKYQWVIKRKCGPNGCEKQAGELWTTEKICLN